MKRRELLAGLALAGVELEAQSPMESLYIPKAHLMEDRKFLHDFMEEFSFVDLVTAAPAIRITHIPVLLDRSAGNYGTIRGHISRQNPQSAALAKQELAVIAFRGPHSYISASWYQTTQAVPTWNFGMVHASGKLKPVEDKATLHAFLGQLIHKFESYEGTSFDFAKLPDSYVNGMISGIIGFEMEIENLEGKFKLGQERSEADRQGILKGLASAKQERGIREFTEAFYRRAAGG